MKPGLVRTSGPAGTPRSRRAGPFRYDWWTVGVVEAPRSDLAEPGFEAPVQWIEPPEPGTYLADPFAVDAETILCEEFHLATARARLVALRIGSSRVHREVVFDSGEHVSYPHVVHVPEGVFVVPEQSYGRVVQLLRWDGRRLEPLQALIAHRSLVDPTPYRDSEGWQIVASPGDDRGGVLGATVSRFRAPELVGPWVHDVDMMTSGSPVHRPAGAMFDDGGRCIRPAQDCRGGYGAAVLFMDHDPIAFRDSIRSQLRAVAGPLTDGCHTVNRFGADRTVIDGKHLAVGPTGVVGRWRRRRRRRPRNS